MKRMLLAGFVGLALVAGAAAQDKKEKDDCGGDGTRAAGAEC